ncbi:MAG: serine/threonine-protein phosphatase, partial [Phycisphaerae bacterium]|nr:serine/threonine-protein phosphatase [Phycisphaerae bacterium]
YYDFFPLSDGRWGLFIADVSGHGTPAAVLMAVTHSIAHGVPGEPDPPSRLLGHVNRQLTRRYTAGNGTFVTAFYGIFDPATRGFTYACAGHPQPRVKPCDGRCAAVKLDQSLSLPLGIIADEPYHDATITLHPGDVLVLFTDGITESRSPTGEMFGIERLDQAVGGCGNDTEQMIRSILLALEDFTDSAAPADDQTLIVARVE